MYLDRRPTYVYFNSVYILDVILNYIVSKLIEKVVCKQINQYMSVNNLSKINQSAYTPNRSTETALIKVKNEMLNAVDNREVVLLVLLDLSAAFDTIDQDVLAVSSQEKPWYLW